MKNKHLNIPISDDLHKKLTIKSVVTGKTLPVMVGEMLEKATTEDVSPTDINKEEQNNE